MLFVRFSEDHNTSCPTGKIKVIPKIDEQNSTMEKLSTLLVLMRLCFDFPAPENLSLCELALLMNKINIARRKSIRDIFAPDIKS